MFFLSFTPVCPHRLYLSKIEDGLEGDAIIVQFPQQEAEIILEMNRCSEVPN